MTRDPILVQSGGLAIHARIGRLFGVGLTSQAWIVSIVVASTFVVAAGLDHT